MGRPRRAPEPAEDDLPIEDDDGGEDLMDDGGGELDDEEDDGDVGYDEETPLMDPEEFGQ